MPKSIPPKIPFHKVYPNKYHAKNQAVLKNTLYIGTLKLEKCIYWYSLETKQYLLHYKLA